MSIPLSERTAQDKTVPGSKTLSFVIVEHDPAMSSLCSVFLKNKGHVVTYIAKDGEEILGSIAEKKVRPLT